MEHHPIHEKVAGLIPSWSADWRWSIDVTLSHQWFSLSVYLSFPLSLKSMNISLGEGKKIKIKPTSSGTLNTSQFIYQILVPLHIWLYLIQSKMITSNWILLLSISGSSGILWKIWGNSLLIGEILDHNIWPTHVINVSLRKNVELYLEYRVCIQWFWVTQGVIRFFMWNFL